MKDTLKLLITKSLRSFSIGFVAIILPLYLKDLGLSDFSTGLIFSIIIAVSATLTIFSHRIAERIGRKHALSLLSLITTLSAAGMFLTDNTLLFTLFALFSFVSVNGVDIGPVFGLENAAFSDAAKGENPKFFSIYSMLGGAFIALGSLSVSTSLDPKLFFLFLALLSSGSSIIYLAIKETKIKRKKENKIPKSVAKKINDLAALFSIDSFGGGFVLQTLIAYFFIIKFGLSQDYLGYVFFIADVLVIISYFFSYRLSTKIGMIKTMVFTHLPSNILLMLIAFAPTAPIAIILYLLRMSLAEMDVPPRQAYTMMVVPKRYRNKAASTTVGTRMYTQAISPLISGGLMQIVSDGSPFLFGGALKIAYDLLLFKKFREIKTISI